MRAAVEGHGHFLDEGVKEGGDEQLVGCGVAESGGGGVDGERFAFGTERTFDDVDESLHVALVLDALRSAELVGGQRARLQTVFALGAFGESFDYATASARLLAPLNEAALVAVGDAKILLPACLLGDHLAELTEEQRRLLCGVGHDVALIVGVTADESLVLDEGTDERLGDFSRPRQDKLTNDAAVVLDSAILADALGG